MSHLRYTLLLGCCLLGWDLPKAHAIAIAPNTDALSLASALLGGGNGIQITGATLSGHSADGAVTSGTFTNSSGTYGIGSGIVLSTGDVADYGDGPNQSMQNATVYRQPATAAQKAILDQVTGSDFNYYDVTQLDITFDLLPGFDTVSFNVVFGSEEYAELLGDLFVDGFGLLVNGTNIAQIDGHSVNVNHPDMAFMDGTELDGILAPDGNPLLLFSHFLGDGAEGNRLTLILADTNDSDFDSTAYIAGLAGRQGGGLNAVGAPEPSSLLLALLGAVGLAFYGWRRRS